jgi:hypothetical protein
MAWEGMGVGEKGGWRMTWRESTGRREDEETNEGWLDE